MCGRVHSWEVEELVSLERWSCSRGASCVVEYTMGCAVECSVSETVQCIGRPVLVLST